MRFQEFRRDLDSEKALQVWRQEMKKARGSAENAKCAAARPANLDIKVSLAGGVQACLPLFACAQELSKTACLTVGPPRPP